MGIQPKVPPPTGVEVVHIPAGYDSKIGVFYLPTISIHHQDYPDPINHTKELENRFKHVPDLQCYTDTFRWDSRSLFDLSINGKGVPLSWQGIYLVYKCEKKSSGLPENDHFKHIPGSCAYGDLFVFRLKKPGNATSGKVEYGSMESGFLQSYFEHGLAKVILYSAAKIYDYKDMEKDSKAMKKKDSGADASEAS